MLYAPFNIVWEDPILKTSIKNKKFERTYFCAFGKSGPEYRKPPVGADPFRESERVRPAGLSTTRTQ